MDGEMLKTIHNLSMKLGTSSVNYTTGPETVAPHPPLAKHMINNSGPFGTATGKIPCHQMSSTLFDGDSHPMGGIL